MKKTSGEKAFSVINTVVMILMILSTLLPFLHVAAKSFSSKAAVVAGKITFWPVGLQAGTYRYVLSQAEFLNSFGVSVIITIVGTALAIFITVTAAYPLSKPRLLGRKVFLLTGG